MKKHILGIVSCAALIMQLSPDKARADGAEFIVSGSSVIISGSLTATGDGFPATSPNSSAAHVNAVVVQNNGVLTLNSGASVWVKNDNNLTAFFRVGYNDALSGTLNINSGAVLQVGQSSHYVNFHVGEGLGTTGVVNQNGGNVTVLGSFNVGVDGGNGTYTINAGSLTIDNADDAGHTSLATIGLNLYPSGTGTSNGQLIINGGTVNILAHELGSSGTFGSTALILGNRDRGVSSYGAGDGTITQSGGVLHIDNRAGLYLSSVGNGMYNLNGGRLEIGGNSLQARYGSGSGTYAFNWGSGTVTVTGSSLNTAVNANLTGGATSVIDTNGFNAVWSGNLTATGSHQIDFGGNALVKIGTGTLTFSGSNRILDTFAVNGGVTQQTAGASSAVEFMVGSGSGAESLFVLSGGTL